MKKEATGSILWHDLTVSDADKVSEFYSKVIGWEKQTFDMGGYNDYVMNISGTEDTAAGICHARGSNANIPPQWLIYVKVENLDSAMKACTDNGGRIIGDKRNMGEHGIYCLIQDPAGAHVMIFER